MKIFTNKIFQLFILFFTFMFVIYFSIDITGENSSLSYTSDEKEYQIYLIKNSDLTADSKSESVMRNNTITLQSVMDKVSESGGGIIHLPAGTYYFSQGGISGSFTYGEAYAIKCRNNVKLVGAGINYSNSSQLTVLKPYYNNQSNTGGMDMFYFNNMDDVGYNYDSTNIVNNEIILPKVPYLDYTDNNKLKYLLNQSLYLINADFENFVIDGTDAKGGLAKDKKYNTSGKGFMINLFKNCDWNKVAVLNTDATGFGMDCPINSTVNNCIAIGCGKAANEESGGASGFGIGTGFSNNEYLQITNSIALNNTKFGFFFEHQGKWTTYYKATTSKGFSVSDSIAAGNLYDFGGLKSDNTTYDKIQGLTGNSSYNVSSMGKTISLKKTTNSAIHNADYSSNVHMNNANIKYPFNDIYNNAAVTWALNKGITDGKNLSTTFRPNDIVTRYEAIIFIYRMAGLPLSLTSATANLRLETTAQSIGQAQYYLNSLHNSGNFYDLELKEEHIQGLSSVYWGLNKSKILSEASNFEPSANSTRAQLLIMLYKLSGSPSVNVTLPYNDVAYGQWYYNAIAWAYSIGLIDNSYGTEFGPNNAITRIETITLLYKYYTNNKVKWNIKYNLQEINTSGCSLPSTYYSGNTVKLCNPTKKGYSFVKWLGATSSYNSTYTLSGGNVLLTPIFKKNTYSISYNLDGGSFSSTPLKSYSIDTVNYTLPVAFKSGYTFKGWTGSNGSTPSKTVVLNPNNLTDLSYTANFTQNTTNVTVSSIAIKSKPTKLTYKVGETFNSNGLSIIVKKSDGTSSTITSGFTLSTSNGAKLTSTGTKTITVTYSGKSTTFMISVNATTSVTVSSIAIKSQPTKLTYKVGETFNSNGLSIIVKKSDGTSSTITSGFTLSTSNAVRLASSGTKKIVVTYAGKTTFFEIIVNSIAINSISIKSKPSKLSYYKSEPFLTSGLILLVNKSDGSTFTLTEGFNTSINNGTILSDVGTKKIVVTYAGKTTSFEIVVNSISISDVSIKTLPLKIKYKVGEKFTSSGLSLEVKKSDGSVSIINSGFALSMENDTIINSSGTKKITITYGTKKLYYDIQVEENTNAIESISIKTLPQKIKFEQGDMFSSEGLVITAKKSDGSNEEIDIGLSLSIEDGEILTQKGITTITVTYEDRTTTYDIKVESKLKSYLKIAVLVVLFIISATVLVKNSSQQQIK